MPDHNRHEVFPAFGLDTFILRDDDHPLRCWRCAGSKQIVLPLDLDHTNAATHAELSRRGILDFKPAVKNNFNRRAIFSRQQIRMVTQAWNIDICLAGSFQNGRAGRHLHRPSIDGQIDGFHIQVFSGFLCRAHVILV